MFNLKWTHNVNHHNHNLGTCHPSENYSFFYFLVQHLEMFTCCPLHFSLCGEFYKVLTKHSFIIFEFGFNL